MKIMELDPTGGVIGELDVDFIFPDRGERPCRYLLEFNNGSQILLTKRDLEDIETAIRNVYGV